MISPIQRPLPDNTQHCKETDIHAPGGIRIRNPSKRATADPRLRPRVAKRREDIIISSKCGLRWTDSGTGLFASLAVWEMRLLDSFKFRVVFHQPSVNIQLRAAVDDFLNLIATLQSAQFASLYKLPAIPSTTSLRECLSMLTIVLQRP